MPLPNMLPLITIFHHNDCLNYFVIFVITTLLVANLTIAYSQHKYILSTLHQVAVIIPFYRNSISAYELIALQQCEKVLGAYHKIAIKPQSLTLPQAATNEVNFTRTESFADNYFKGSYDYNRLMLSEEFYARFANYEYILIYQLDAFVFSDQLKFWCSQDLDYIGAPWLRDRAYGDRFKALKAKLKKDYHTRFDVQRNGVPSRYQFENRVGNGGFSLRRVKKFLHVTQTRRADIERYLAKVKQRIYEYSEDVFWSIEVNRKTKYLNIPSYQTGVSFSFETLLNRAYEINGQQLPFGCHAWDRYTEFWEPIFKQYGYNLLPDPIINFEAETAVAIKYLYRISDAGNPKNKLSAATKIHCLQNFIKEFKHNIYVFADNCSDETIQAIRSLGVEPVMISLGNSKSWRHVAKTAIDTFEDNSFVYLVEDDYLHLPGSLTALQEGLKVADYVTLYDHLDKYTNHADGGPNPHIINGGELSRVMVTASTHWKQTNSTTMTFATRVKTLKEDRAVWWRFTEGNIPDDFHAFETLINGGQGSTLKRTLISPLPGLATHTELEYLAPLTQWHPVKSWEDV